MPFVKLTGESEATGTLKAIYDAATARAGYVANIIKTMSPHPATAQASIGFYACLMKSENALNKARKEMLAAVVSNINDCYY